MTAVSSALPQGYRDLRAGKFAQERERCRRLAGQGQRPETLVMAC
jgi:carbonic anhydrase